MYNRSMIQPVRCLRPYASSLPKYQAIQKRFRSQYLNPKNISIRFGLNSKKIVGQLPSSWSPLKLINDAPKNPGSSRYYRLGVSHAQTGYALHSVCPHFPFFFSQIRDSATLLWARFMQRKRDIFQSPKISPHSLIITNNE